MHQNVHPKHQYSQKLQRRHNDVEEAEEENSTDRRTERTEMKQRIENGKSY